MFGKQFWKVFFYSRYYKTLSKQSDLDKAEVEVMNEDKTKFLQKAVENYLKCLTYGDKHDLRIFRLISLWFSNSSVQSVNALIEVHLGLFYRQYIDTWIITNMFTPYIKYTRVLKSLVFNPSNPNTWKLLCSWLACSS